MQPTHKRFVYWFRCGPPFFCVSCVCMSSCFPVFCDVVNLHCLSAQASEKKKIDTKEKSVFLLYLFEWGECFVKSVVIWDSLTYLWICVIVCPPPNKSTDSLADEALKKQHVCILVLPCCLCVYVSVDIYKTRQQHSASKQEENLPAEKKTLRHSLTNPHTKKERNELNREQQKKTDWQSSQPADTTQVCCRVATTGGFQHLPWNFAKKEAKINRGRNNLNNKYTGISKQSYTRLQRHWLMVFSQTFVGHQQKRSTQKAKQNTQVGQTDRLRQSGKIKATLGVPHKHAHTNRRRRCYHHHQRHHL